MSRSLAACLLACTAAAAAPAGDVFDEPTLEFLRRVDADGLGLLGVQYRGRVAILETLAREQLDQMTGAQGLQDVPATVAYLEIYLRGGRYLDRPLLYVREKKMGALLREKLDGETGAAFDRTRRLPPAAMLDAEGWHVLLHAGRAEPADLDRARRVEPLSTALAELSQRRELRVPMDRLSVRYSSFLAMGVLRVAPAGGAEWLALEDALTRTAAETRPGAETPAVLWARLAEAWRARDAAGVNRRIARLAKSLRATEGPEYPSRTTRRLERFYTTFDPTVGTLVGYAVSLALLVAAVATSRRRAWTAGMIVFAGTTLLLLAGFVLRWIVSGRPWYLPPMMNQYEAVIGSALLGALVAVVLELVWRRGYFALAAGLYAIVALVSGLLFPEQMDSALRAQPGILSSPVMAAHVAVIIVGHALVGMTFFISYVYLLVVAARRGSAVPLALVAPVQAAGWVLVAAATWIGMKHAGPDTPLRAWMIALAAGGFLLLLGQVVVLAAVGIGLRPVGVSSGPDLVARGHGGAGGAIDRCNLIVAQLACWMVVGGTILGAVWGDFAWGRWWGWDPKETWALITCLVYVALLHVRFVTPTRWRGYVTALVCLLGCVAMLFNWVIVNFVLPGKHSYA